MQNVLLILLTVCVITFGAAYAEIDVDGTTITGAFDGTIVNLTLLDDSEKKIWEKSVEFENTFEITMPRLESGHYTLLAKYGNIGGESESIDFQYDGPSTNDVFEITIELPENASQNFDHFALRNEKTNLQVLGDLILDSPDPIRQLEVIKIQMEEGKNTSSKELDDTQRWTDDGNETLEYGIHWTTHRAYNDVHRFVNQILELTNDGMSLESAFEFLGYSDIPFVIKDVKKDYEGGELVTATGEVFDITEDTINYKIYSPSGTLIYDWETELTYYGLFSSSTSTNGDGFQEIGEYTIEVTYDGFAQSFTFNLLSPGKPSTPETISEEDSSSPESSPELENAKEPDSKPDPKPQPEPDVLEIPAPFVEESKDPQYYVDRYTNEPKYKEWFDENYPEYSSIYQAVGLSEPIPDWVKGVFKFWSNDQISDDELKNAIRFLVNEGIIVL